MNVKIPIGRLAERLSAVSGVSVQSAESFIKSFFELAADTLVSGEVLKIKGLGSFEPDPSNADFPVRFTPDKELADTLNAPFAEFEAETLRDDLSKPELELMAAVEAQQEEVSKEITDQSLEPAPVEESAPVEEPAKEEIDTDGQQQIENPSVDNTPEEKSAESPEKEEVFDIEELELPEAPAVPVPTSMLSDFEQKKEETEPSTEVETEVSTVEADEKEDSNDEKSSEVQSEEVANPSEAEPEEILVEQPVTPVIVEPTQPLNDEESAPAVKPVTAKTVTESENEDDEEELYVATPKSSGGSGFGLGFLVGIIVGLAIGACAAYFAIDYINPTPSPTVILPVEDEIAEEIDSMTTLVTEPTDSVADPVTQESEAEVTSPALSPEPVEEKTAKPSQPETPQPTETTKSSASVKDTVKPGYNLAKMALHHYGAKNFWVYIYEENKDKIKNPNNLPAGLVLVIPPASKYGIDPKNPASLQAAKEKEAQIVSKHSNK